MDSLLRGSNMDIGGFPVSYSGGDNQGSDTVFPHRDRSRRQYHPLQNLDDAVN